MSPDRRIKLQTGLPPWMIDDLAAVKPLTQKLGAEQVRKILGLFESAEAAPAGVLSSHAGPLDFIHIVKYSPDESLQNVSVISSANPR